MGKVPRSRPTKGDPVYPPLATAAARALLLLTRSESGAGRHGQRAAAPLQVHGLLKLRDGPPRLGPKRGKSGPWVFAASAISGIVTCSSGPVSVRAGLLREMRNGSLGSNR